MIRILFALLLFALPVAASAAGTTCQERTENVSLTHTIPTGPAIEMPLSLQGVRTITITGGCVPDIDADGTEIARRCDFRCGIVKIIDAVRFEH